MGVLAGLRARLRPGRPRPAILMYHRIAEPACDPWSLAVSPAGFESQVQALAQRRTPLPLDEFARLAGEGALPDDAIAVTFDDGYLDNLTTALPILRRHGVPATLFLATGFVGQRVEFWWDELARLILLREGLLDGEFELAGETIALRLPPMDDAARRAAHAWRASGPPADARQQLYLDLWRRLQTLDGAKREAALAELRPRLDSGPPPEADLPMNAQQVAMLATEGTVTLGGHTVDHRRLVDLSPPEQLKEMRDGRAACEQLSGVVPSGLAYPYGSINETAKAAAREVGFTWACTTEAAFVPRQDVDLFALPRIAAAEEDGERLLRRLEAR